MYVQNNEHCMMYSQSVLVLPPLNLNFCH